VVTVIYQIPTGAVAPLIMNARVPTGTANIRWRCRLGVRSGLHSPGLHGTKSERDAGALPLQADEIDAEKMRLPIPPPTSTLNATIMALVVIWSCVTSRRPMKPAIMVLPTCSHVPEFTQILARQLLAPLLQLHLEICSSNEIIFVQTTARSKLDLETDVSVARSRSQHPSRVPISRALSSSDTPNPMRGKPYVN